jgi:hypothetical protein
MRSPRARDCGILSQGCPQQAWKAIPHPYQGELRKTEHVFVFDVLLFDISILLFQLCEPHASQIPLSSNFSGVFRCSRGTL